MERMPTRLDRPDERPLLTQVHNAEVAERLGCTVRTVETHLTALLDRADASSRLEIVAAFWTDY